MITVYSQKMQVYWKPLLYNSWVKPVNLNIIIEILIKIVWVVGVKELWRKSHNSQNKYMDISL